MSTSRTEVAEVPLFKVKTFEMSLDMLLGWNIILERQRNERVMRSKLSLVSLSLISLSPTTFPLFHSLFVSQSLLIPLYCAEL